MEELFSGFKQALETIVDSRVIETVTENISKVLPINQEDAESIRGIGAKTQSFFNCINNLPTELSKCQESRDLTRAIHSVVQRELEKHPNSETGDYLQVLDLLTHSTQSVMSKLEEELEEFPSNQSNETASAGQTVNRVGDVIKFSGSIVEMMMKTFQDMTMDNQIGTSCVETLSQFMSITPSVINDTKKTLEEAVANDQGTDETAQNRAVISDNPFLEAISPINNINDVKALLSVIREAIALGAGAAGYNIFGPTGAAIAGLLTCTAFDGMHTGAKGNKDGPKGIWALITSKKSEDIRTAVQIILSDALVGYTGGRFFEKTTRSWEIDAFERIKERRASLGLNNPVATTEVWTEVKDLETGKMYYGVNKKIRRKVKLTEPRDPKPNLYVRDYPIEEELPIDREAQTCAEMHAFHELLKEKPNADVTKTRVNTFVLLKDGTYKNITRCDNCMTRDHHMGKVPTDIMPSGFIVDENLPPNLPSDYYPCPLVPPTWSSTERSIMTRAEYNKCIRLAISVYRQLNEKINGN